MSDDELDDTWHTPGFAAFTSTQEAIAYHEAGHTAVAYLLFGSTAVRAVTIKSNHAAGYAGYTRVDCSSLDDGTCLGSELVGIVSASSLEELREEIAYHAEWREAMKIRPRRRKRFASVFPEAMPEGRQTISSYTCFRSNSLMGRVERHIMVSLAGPLAGARVEKPTWSPDCWDLEIEASPDAFQATTLAQAACGWEDDYEWWLLALRDRTAKLVDEPNTQAIIHALADALLERETLTGEEVAWIAREAVIKASVTRPKGE